MEREFSNYFFCSYMRYDFLVDFLPRPEGCLNIIAPQYEKLHKEEKNKIIEQAKITKEEKDEKP